MASNYFTKGLKRSALTVALGLCFAGGVQAQSTTGNVHGTAAPGTTIVVSNNSGLSRTVTADQAGRYNISSLPVGNYTVEAQGIGKRQITVTVGQGTYVAFGADTAQLETITVTSASVPVIDITSVDTRTVLTYNQLKRLPMARSAEAIALLAPGAVAGKAGVFGSQVSFGGSSVAENAYYLNGYFSGNPITNVGGFTLPYGSIEQQEMYTAGYGARYGRSSGGVISQVGRSGTNDWQFGGQVIWTPKQLKEEPKDIYYPNLDLPAGYEYSNPDLAGVINTRGKDRLSWNTTYSAYVGGPIVSDKLFFFISAETDESRSRSPGGNPDVGYAATASTGEASDPKLYAKVNWNIAENHLLEGTYVYERYDATGKIYNFDWDTYQYGDYRQPGTAAQDDTDLGSIKYTGYLTDNLTLSGLWGRYRNSYNEDPYLTGSPYLAGTGSQNPALNGGHPITNTQGTYRATKHTRNSTDGLRLELEWVLGDHTLIGGIDNTELTGENEGTSQVADAWVYGKSANERRNVSAALGVGPIGVANASICNGTPNQANADGSSTNCGYWVYQLKYFDTTSMRNKQEAKYIEDRWQITDNFLLSLGVRADQFKNYSDTGVEFVDSGTQWQPRLGASWDVKGDSSLKLFANAGRYFLNMPNAVAIRGVGASTYTREYYTYTGIDANGKPTGLTPINGVGTGVPAGPVSSNGELGGPKDPLMYVPEDIKSQYQDEFSLGVEWALTENWTAGAKVTDRRLKSAIDDFCDTATMMDAAGMEVLGYDYNRAQYIAEEGGKFYGGAGCYMFNPGGSNTFAFQEVTPNATGGYDTVVGSYKKLKVSAADMGFPDLERSYKGLDLFLERPWDGKWEARFDYTYSKSRGNSEGPANSDTGQGSNPHDNGVATSQNWDAWQIMAFANGYLPNDRRHVLKARFSWAFTDELSMGARATIASGSPVSCFGYYDPDGSIPHDSAEADPIGYYASYHTCFGEDFAPGKEYTPWTRRLDLSLNYRPQFFDQKLGLGLNVFNVFNDITETSYAATSEVHGGPYVINNNYRQPGGYTTPRYIQLSATYDW